MRSRHLAVVLVLPVVLAAASCTSDGGKSDKSSGARSSAPGSSSASADISALVAKLKAGVRPLKSAHFTISAKVGGEPLTGAGDQKLDAGRLTALKAGADVPGGVGNVSIVVVGAKRYVKLPAPFATKQKPWVPITADSTNVIVKQLAGFVDAALSAASLGSLPDITSATTKLTNKGTSAGTTHYALVIDPAKLPGNLSTTAALGTKPIPAELYVDSSGRPVKVQVALSVLGQSTDTTVTFSDFDAPVSVAAPPAGQIATD